MTSADFVIPLHPMNCRKCDADIGDTYEPDDRSLGIRGGWYCNACDLAIGEHEVPREPMAGDVEIMSARGFRGDRPLGTPLSELSSPNWTSMEVLMPPHSVSADGATAEPSEVVPLAVTPHEQSEKDFTWNIGMKRADLLTVAPSRHYPAPVLLTARPSPSASSVSRSTVGLLGRWGRVTSLDGSSWPSASPLIWRPSFCPPPPRGYGTPVSGQPR
jgi:hypothetical protein